MCTVFLLVYNMIDALLSSASVNLRPNCSRYKQHFDPNIGTDCLCYDLPPFQMAEGLPWLHFSLVNISVKEHQKRSLSFNYIG